MNSNRFRSSLALCVCVCGSFLKNWLEKLLRAVFSCSCHFFFPARFACVLCQCVHEKEQLVLVTCKKRVSSLRNRIKNIVFLLFSYYNVLLLHVYNTPRVSHALVRLGCYTCFACFMTAHIYYRIHIAIKVILRAKCLNPA